MRLLILLAAMVICGPASGHDFWVQPAHFTVAPGDDVSATLMVGHGPARQRSPIAAERITRFETIGPQATTDQHQALHPGLVDDATLRLGAAGVYVVVLETNYTTTTLPALRYNDYLVSEGLRAVSDWRSANGLTEQPGRELYCRRAKSLIVVDSVDAEGRSPATMPTGMSLEIVPMTDPTTLKAGESFRVAVLYQGKPLSQATVKLTDLAADERPVATELTGTDGDATFTVPYKGQWLLNVIWSVPAPNNPAADYLTTFSSLSFAIS